MQLDSTHSCHWEKRTNEKQEELETTVSSDRNNFNVWLLPIQAEWQFGDRTNKEGLGLVRDGQEHGYDELKKYKNYLKYTLDINAP